MKEKYIDNTALDKLCQIGGDQLLCKMIILFLEHGPKRLEAALEGEQSGDLKGITKAVHSLKSSAGNLGAIDLQQLAAQIEQLAEDQQTESLPDLLRQLEVSFSHTQFYLEAEKKRLENK